MNGTMTVRGTLSGTLSPVASLSGTLSPRATLSGTLTIPKVIGPDTYQGPYEATPSEDTQVLQTGDYLMSNNITIHPIPSNYGRIAWNGSVLTVF